MLVYWWWWFDWSWCGWCAQNCTCLLRVLVLAYQLHRLFSFSVLMAVFSRWTWVSRYDNISILDFIGAMVDGSGGHNWSCTTCKTSVKSSSPTNHNPSCLQAGCSSCHQTNSVRALKVPPFLLHRNPEQFGILLSTNLVLLGKEWLFKMMCVINNCYLFGDPTWLERWWKWEPPVKQKLKAVVNGQRKIFVVFRMLFLFDKVLLLCKSRVSIPLSRVIFISDSLLIAFCYFPSILHVARMLGAWWLLWYFSACCCMAFLAVDEL